MPRELPGDNMPKCNFCECDITLPSSGSTLETECPRCGRSVELKPEDLLQSSSASETIILTGLTSGKSLELPINNSLVLGRDNYGSEIFQDRKFSRKHCLIETNLQALSICDLGSMNGTFVNGIRISAKTTLKSDDTIMLADETFILKIKSPAIPELQSEAPGFVHVCANCGYQSSEDLPRCPECGFGFN